MPISSPGAAGNPLDDILEIEQNHSFAPGSMTSVHGTGAMRCGAGKIGGARRGGDR